MTRGRHLCSELQHSCFERLQLPAVLEQLRLFFLDIFLAHLVHTRQALIFVTRIRQSSGIHCMWQAFCLKRPNPANPARHVHRRPWTSSRSRSPDPAASHVAHLTQTSYAFATSAAGNQQARRCWHACMRATRQGRHAATSSASLVDLSSFWDASSPRLSSSISFLSSSISVFLAASASAAA